MDYIEETNAFIDWLETNPLEPSAQTLWFHLMAIANKSGYPEWFAVTNPLLQAKVGISENSLIKHRNTLYQKGRIDYRSQGKKQAGKYKIIPFTSNIAVMRVVTEGVMRGVESEVKGSALKELKDITTTTTTTTSAHDEYSFGNVFKAYEKNFATDKLREFEVQEFGYLFDDYGGEWLLKAMREAFRQGQDKRNLAYVKGILDGYKERGGPDVERKKPSGQGVTKSKGQQQIDELDKMIEEESRRGTNRDSPPIQDDQKAISIL